MGELATASRVGAPNFWASESLSAVLARALPHAPRGLLKLREAKSSGSPGLEPSRRRVEEGGSPPSRAENRGRTVCRADGSTPAPGARRRWPGRSGRWRSLTEAQVRGSRAETHREAAGAGRDRLTRRSAGARAPLRVRAAPRWPGRRPGCWRRGSRVFVGLRAAVLARASATTAACVVHRPRRLFRGQLSPLLLKLLLLLGADQCLHREGVRLEA